ncbi:MAG: NADH:ubiquinone reductase (Na(+)-transporting) subunit B [Planctomycetes bacterium]|nr:NADH:ubiquinone reductase (Na(+)-transporting) subunit B [Planctomycetota bacterium]
MKPLRSFLDRIRPLFEKGGKLEKLYPLYEGIDTFFYTSGEVTPGPSHVRDSMDLKRMMITVVIALVPCMFMAMWNTGYQANLAMQSLDISTAPGWRGAVLEGLGVGCSPDSFWSNFVHGALYFLPIYLVCMVVGGAWEVLFSCVRKHEINEGFFVTGALFPLTLPPTIPLWQVALGISFGVVFGKEVFGGTGRNFLNPALTARAFLYFAYPAHMSGDSIWTAVDGFSRATPLGAQAVATIQQGVSASQQFAETMQSIHVTWSQAFLGTIQGSLGETSALACLIGAAILILTGIGSWRIMVSTLLGAYVFSWLLYGVGVTHLDSISNPMFLMPPHWHLVTGGLAFGLVFMATDPVSASMTETGKWYYGALIGIMTILIRVVNPAYPEGVMLAILFGNVFAPLIDYFVIQANIRRRLARNAA